VELDPSVPIKINALDGALFMERLNDLSFEREGMEKQEAELLEMINAGCDTEEIRKRLMANKAAGLQA
jgi:hypothetical protein